MKERHMKYTAIISLLLLLLLSCQKKEPKIKTINGVWESVGSGWVLQIEDSTSYSLFDITSISCLTSRQASLTELIESLSLRKDTLYLNNGVMTYAFTRSGDLPKSCTDLPSEEEKKDPMYNFEVFAETVNKHYAFLELNGINWETLYEQQKGKLSKNPSSTTLYLVLEETLELLNDNHAFLEATDEVYEAVEQLTPEPQESATQESLQEYGDFVVANLVAEHHLKEDMTSKDSWLVKWGMMEDTIGYVQVKAMWLYADLDIPEKLIEENGYVDAYVETFHTMYEGEYVKKEVAGISKIMDSIMNDLSHAASIVIDVRFNGGGQDAVNFEILKRLNSKKRQIVTAKLKHEDGFSPLQRIYLESSSTPYIKPVFILTSSQSGSAAESFAIGSMSLPHVKRIGSSTQGALSTALEKKLPNGWTFAISNEIYMDNQGNSYENIGVPVDYSLDYPDDRQTFFRYVAHDLEYDKQTILKAMSELGSR